MEAPRHRRAAPPSSFRHMFTIPLVCFGLFFSPAEVRGCCRCGGFFYLQLLLLLTVVLVVVSFSSTLFFFVASVRVRSSQLWVPLSIRPSLGSTARPSLLPRLIPSE